MSRSALAAMGAFLPFVLGIWSATPEAGGYVSKAVPSRARLAGFSITRNGTAHVRLRSTLAPFHWVATYTSAQVVYTLTEFSEVKRVLMRVNGQPCCMYDVHAKAIRKTLTRRTFSGWQGAPGS